jgi:uncharacterized protein (DUF1778 family)
MQKQKLFKTKEASERRSLTLKVRVTVEEHQLIIQNAKVRQMDVSEFMRRTALLRRADVDYETEMVLALSTSTRVIRELHAGMVERGIAPPVDELRSAILDSRSAILRISNSV